MRRGLLATPLAAVACVVLLLPAGAGAATVVNGDFEAGTLTGWTVVNPGEFEAGSWFAYSGTAAPTEEGEPGARQVPPPPQGNFAAITDQGGEGLHILYQDIAIEPALSQTLSMLVYYHSYAEITVPSPDTLSPESSANQQYRIDVMKPSAPIDSVNPADILTTVFRANTGDPEELSPKLVTANLTPFGGQTVRLRLAEVDNQFYFNAGTDAVSISTVPLPPPPSNVFTFGKLKLNKKKGTGALLVNVPGPGTLTVVDGGSSGAAASSVASASKKKKALIKSTTVTATAAGLATVNLKPTGAGKKILKSKHKLRFKVLVTFTPTGGAAATQTFRGTLKKKPKPKPKPKRG
ncbi:MAG TPA: hypothetical protein VHQ43_11110 [Solirubrobacterales bacterium]|nr:hypothetical protein [Solirubrobacterales bacterium]